MGKGPTSLAAGDFNSDGHFDIAAYNSSDVTVTMLLGDGGGNFIPVTPDFPMTVGGELAAGDVDRDGDLDLVATLEASDAIVVALGKDDGTFSAPTAISGAGKGPMSLVLEDFNRDGTLDVVTNNSVSRDIEFFRGDGTGGFSPGPLTPSGVSVPARIAAGDVNGNGILDVVLSDQGSRTISVLTGGGNGLFFGPYGDAGVFDTFGIALEDFNRDGRDDIAVGYIAANEAGLLTSLSGIPCRQVSFGHVGHEILVGQDPIAITTGDFDQDANLDFVSLSANQNSITRWLGRGIGRFQNTEVRSTGGPPVSMDGADFDLDGDRDIVTAISAPPQLLIHWNVSGSFDPPSVYPLGAAPRQVVAADVSFDGKVDLVVSLASTSVLVFLNDGTGNFLPPGSFAVGPSPGPLAVGDFDNDNLADIAVGESNRIVFLRNSGGGSFGSAGSHPLGASATGIRAALLDGGNLDLIVTTGNGAAGTFTSLLGDGAYGFVTGASVPLAGGPSSSHGIAIADLDLDGHLDAAVANADQFRVQVLLGNGSGGFGPVLIEPIPGAPVSVAAGDYDRDGTPDLLAGISGASQVFYLPGTGGGDFHPGFFQSLSADARAPAVDDFDQDGRPDVALGNFDDDSVSIFLGFGDGNFGPAGGPFSISPSRGPRWVTVGDFDDDGFRDIVASAQSGELVFLGGGGGFPTMVTSPTGQSPYISRAADFDFDGRLDLAVLNGNDVEIYKGNGAGGFVLLRPLALGGIGTGLAVGDFDRDGLIDVAATQTTDDTFVLFLGSGPGTWGAPLQRNPGRDPMDFDAADFDQDGFVDFAIPLKADDTVRLLFSSAAPPWAVGPALPAPRAPVSLRAPDVNRDEKPDLVVASQDDHLLSIRLSDGPGSFEPTRTDFTVGVRGPVGMAVSDFDRDGAPDLAVVPDSPNFTTPAGFASVMNTNCRPRLLDFISEVSTCDLPGSPFSSQPSLKVIDDGENVIQCEARLLTAGIVPGTGTGGASVIGMSSIIPAPSSGTYSYSNIGVNLAGGGYQLRFTHAEAREKRSRTFSQNLPVNIFGPSALCQGDPALYTSEPGNDMYSWFVDSSPVSMAPSIDLTSFFASSPGGHGIDLSVQRDSCSAGTFLSVDATPILSGLGVTPLGPISVCETCTGPLATASPTGGGATTYQWGFRLSLGGTITPFAGETSATYVIEGSDFPGPGTYFLVATASPACGLALDSNDVQIDVSFSTPEPLHAFTALSTSGQNFLEWATPTTPCSAVHILRRSDGVFPTGPSDPLATWVSGADFPCAPNDTDAYPDTGLADDTKYYYSAWVRNGGVDSLEARVKGRPFDNSGKVKWAFATGATLMAQAGIRIAGGTSSLYVPSNDDRVYGLVGGSSGGQWLSRPALMTLPSQARPPVVPFLVGTSPNEAPNGAAFVASQDGNVYVLDADDLGPVWTTSVAESLNAAAAGIFAGFGSSKDWVLIGTRNTVGANGFHGIRVDDGSLDWFFDNSLALGGDGTPMGVILGGASVDYPGQRVFVGSWKGVGGMSTIWALDISSTDDAVLDWSRDIGDVEASPVYLGGGKLVVGTKTSEVHLLDANNLGAPLWTSPYDANDGGIKGFVFPYFLGGATNFLFSTNTKVTSIKDNGTAPAFNWEITGIPAPSVSIQIPETTSALVGSGDGKLYAINGIHTVTPTTVFVQLGDGLSGIGPPAVGVLDSMVYPGSEEGVLYAVEWPFP